MSAADRIKLMICWLMMLFGAIAFPLGFYHQIHLRVENFELAFWVGVEFAGLAFGLIGEASHSAIKERLLMTPQTKKPIA